MEFWSPVNHIFPESDANEVLNGSKIDFPGNKKRNFHGFCKITVPALVCMVKLSLGPSPS
jgi:hypothetical protein